MFFFQGSNLYTSCFQSLCFIPYLALYVCSYSVLGLFLSCSVSVQFYPWSSPVLVFYFSFVFDLVVSQLYPSRVLVLFLRLLGFRGLGLFLILYWFRSYPLGLCSSSSSICVLVLVPYWVHTCSVFNLILQSCFGPQSL